MVEWECSCGETFDGVVSNHSDYSEDLGDEYSDTDESTVSQASSQPLPVASPHPSVTVIDLTNDEESVPVSVDTSLALSVPLPAPIESLALLPPPAPLSLALSVSVSIDTSLALSVPPPAPIESLALLPPPAPLESLALPPHEMSEKREREAELSLSPRNVRQRLSEDEVTEEVENSDEETTDEDAREQQEAEQKEDWDSSPQDTDLDTEILPSRVLDSVRFNGIPFDLEEDTLSIPLDYLIPIFEGVFKTEDDDDGNLPFWLQPDEGLVYVLNTFPEDRNVCKEHQDMRSRVVDIAGEDMSVWKDVLTCITCWKKLYQRANHDMLVYVFKCGRHVMCMRCLVGYIQRQINRLFPKLNEGEVVPVGEYDDPLKFRCPSRCDVGEYSGEVITIPVQRNTETGLVTVRERQDHTRVSKMGIYCVNYLSPEAPLLLVGLDRRCIYPNIVSVYFLLGSLAYA